MVKNLQCRKPRFETWVGKLSQRREWQSTLLFLLGESHGQRSVVGSIGWQRVRHDGATNTHTFLFLCNPLLLSLTQFFSRLLA